jgi:hypothetical protein
LSAWTISEQDDLANFQPAPFAYGLVEMESHDSLYGTSDAQSGLIEMEPDSNEVSLDSFCFLTERSQVSLPETQSDELAALAQSGLVEMEPDSNEVSSDSLACLTSSQIPQAEAKVDQFREQQPLVGDGWRLVADMLCQIESDSEDLGSGTDDGDLDEHSEGGAVESKYADPIVHVISFFCVCIHRCCRQCSKAKIGAIRWPADAMTMCRRGALQFRKRLRCVIRILFVLSDSLGLRAELANGSHRL